MISFAPMQIQRTTPQEIKDKYKLVRADSYTDVGGEIIEASEETGECIVKVKDLNGEMKETALKFGVHGVKIVLR